MRTLCLAIGLLLAPVAAAQSAPDSLLARQLALRVEADQAARGLWTLAFQSGRDVAREDGQFVTAIDSLNTAWIKGVLAERGWPTTRMVGEQGSNHAWLLVQHADRDRPFQREALGLMRNAVDAGEASALELAYLTDRVRRASGELQLYGTQLNMVDGAPVPFEIEDPEGVDARRAAVGLGTMAEYIELFRRDVLGEGDEADEADAQP